MFIGDLHGGLTKLGWACLPNNNYNHDNMSLFVDNLLTYGTNYIGIQDTYKAFEHRQQRLTALSELTIVIKTLGKIKDEIKDVQINSNEDDLRQLITACFNLAIKFFDNLKRLMK